MRPRARPQPRPGLPPRGRAPPHPHTTLVKLPSPSVGAAPRYRFADASGSKAVMEPHERVVASEMSRRRFGRMALVALGLVGTGAASALGACSSGDDSAGGDLASES